SSVYVTTVGGTRFSGNIGSGWPGETAWAYTPGSPPTGSGGGYSQYFGRPTWQVAPGYSGTHRGYPDVSAVGDPNTGFFMCYGNSSTCIQVGGTSLSAPVWAGLLSIMNQYLAAQGKPIIGFASPKLYPLVNSAQPYPPFHDITSGTNGAYQCRTGWDEVTGLGSPDAWNLVRDLAAASSSTATPTATTTTPSPVVTNTPGVGPSNTPGVGPSNTPRPASPTPVSCTPGQFSDVPSGSPFYVYITDLVSRGAISGYADCTFRPFNTITRGQVAKVLVLGFGLSINTAGGPHFEDVPSGSAFYNFVETAYNLGIISGYSCGGPGEPCDSQNRPYFRPNTNVTRGQLAKMVSIGRGWALLNPSTATFADVPVGSAFYRYVETVAAKSIISGYNCGGPGEPCDSQNRPYFRQYNNATRGQGAKIIDLSIYASDSTPTNTPNAAPTNTRPPGPTNTPGVAPTNTPGPAPTNTPGPGLTNTPSPAPTTPPPASATRTATPGITGTATPTSVATQTPEPPPRITGFAPASVEQYDTETQINMTGTSFGLQQGAGFVVVNSHVATVDSWNDTLIQFHINVNTPPGNPVTVRLVRDDGQLVDQPTGFAVTPRQHPYVFSYLPNSVHQGDTLTTITINGTRFGTTPGTVTLLGVYSATITSWNDTQIQFHIAANTPPSSPISVVIYSPDNGSYKEYGLFAVLP
ncbi:MAG TPA: S-layer homology domain-containing protein, partial [Chloroflexia bacterium]|nr:S-layer homology domain-containing protein [Chloroflexia bacterium]